MIDRASAVLVVTIKGPGCESSKEKRRDIQEEKRPVSPWRNIEYTSRPIQILRRPVVPRRPSAQTTCLRRLACAGAALSVPLESSKSVGR